ncbi:MAG: hypothetical protein ACXVRA_13390 [Gaiellaceae bacterium]
MTDALPPRPFSRQAHFDAENLVGARWWQESLRLRPDPVGRRTALKALLIVGGSAAAFGLVAALGLGGDDDDLRDISMDALDLQKRAGWNVGLPAALRFPRSSTVDADGKQDWAGALDTLALEMAPSQPALAPYYVPTLFQALSAPSLRQAMNPVPPPPGDDDVRRGQALLSLFRAVDTPTDTAVILDLDGPVTAAVAAGMAPAFDPVFVFDNWPHPLGVVPSHVTLGSMLFYRPLFLRARETRTAPAPPVFVLDRRRLSHYVDQQSQFDNRYVAKLPTSENLRSLGVRHVLYVVPGKSDLRELDDLNDDFVAFADSGIDVKMMALTDLAAPADVAQAAPGTAGSAPVAHYYGGSPHTHLFFWNTYGWHTPRSASPTPRSGARAPALPEPRPPMNVSNGAAYKPVQRPTIFSARRTGMGAGVGKQKPSGFGVVSVRASKSTGRITGLRTGRSGSFGRGFSSSG